MRFVDILKNKTIILLEIIYNNGLILANSAFSRVNEVSGEITQDNPLRWISVKYTTK